MFIEWVNWSMTHCEDAALRTGSETECTGEYQEGGVSKEEEATQERFAALIEAKEATRGQHIRGRRGRRITQQ